MTSRACRVMGACMLALALVVGMFWYASARRAHDDEISRLTDAWYEQEMQLERQRQVIETIMIIECRRRPTTCQGQPLGRRAAGQECIRKVTINGYPRSRNCSPVQEDR